MEQHERQKHMTIVARPQVVTPADWVPGPRQGEWTYDDYARLDDGQDYEIVGGVLFFMPKPAVRHQDIALEVALQLRLYMRKKKIGQVYPEIDVHLSPNDTVAPDVLVVLNENKGKVAEKYFIGAPDIVVEIASPSTSKHDRIVKRGLYAHYGVPEYWLVRPKQQTIEVLILENGTYCSTGVFRGNDTLHSRILPALPLKVEQFFPTE